MKKNIRKVSIILSLLLISILIIGLVLNNHDKTESDNIQFTMANDLYQKTGFTLTAKTENAEYFIGDFSEAECIDYIEGVEQIIKVAVEEYQMPLPQGKLKVFLTKKDTMSTSYRTGTLLESEG